MKRSLRAAVLLFSLTGFLSAQQSYTLEHTFEKGKIYRYHDFLTAVSVQEMMGKEMKTSATVDAVLRFSADDVTKEGTATIIVSADSMTVSSKSPMRDTTMVMKDMIGKRMKMVVAKTGQVLNREVIDTVKSEAMRYASQREGVRFIVFSEKPVKIGEKWNTTTTDSADMMGGKITTTTERENTVIGIENKGGIDCLKIAHTAKTNFSGKGKMMGMDIFIEGTGKVVGTTFIDPLKGVVVSEETQTDSESTVAVTGQQNMTIPSSQTVKTAHTLIQK